MAPASLMQRTIGYAHEVALFAFTPVLHVEQAEATHVSRERPVRISAETLNTSGRTLRQDPG